MEAGNDLRNAKISWPDILDWDCCEARVATLLVHRRVDADADLSENMSRNRFEIILSHLHFNDNEQRPPDSPIQISQRGMPQPTPRQQVASLVWFFKALVRQHHEDCNVEKKERTMLEDVQRRATKIFSKMITCC